MNRIINSTCFVICTIVICVLNSTSAKRNLDVEPISLQKEHHPIFSILNPEQPTIIQVDVNKSCYVVKFQSDIDITITTLTNDTVNNGFITDTMIPKTFTNCSIPSPSNSIFPLRVTDGLDGSIAFETEINLPENTTLVFEFKFNNKTGTYTIGGGKAIRVSPSNVTQVLTPTRVINATPMGISSICEELHLKSIWQTFSPNSQNISIDVSLTKLKFEVIKRYFNLQNNWTNIGFSNVTLDLCKDGSGNDGSGAEDRRWRSIGLFLMISAVFYCVHL